MTKVLITTVAVLVVVGVGPANAFSNRHIDNTVPNQDAIGCEACSVKNPAIFLGWMKSPDVGCVKLEHDIEERCYAIDHYTDNYLKGGHCATYRTPLFDHPNGKPIGLVWGELQIYLGGKSSDGKWTRVYRSPADEGGVFPYSLKSLRECG